MVVVVVEGHGGPEHSAISSGSPGHCELGWLCFVSTRYLVGGGGLEEWHQNISQMAIVHINVCIPTSSSAHQAHNSYCKHSKCPKHPIGTQSWKLRGVRSHLEILLLVMIIQADNFEIIEGYYNTQSSSSPSVSSSSQFHRRQIP